jgi:predicted transcriptional regulator with HTH domain
MPGKYDGKSSLIHLGKFPPVENHGFQPVHVKNLQSYVIKRKNVLSLAVTVILL